MTCVGVGAQEWLEHARSVAQDPGLHVHLPDLPRWKAKGKRQWRTATYADVREAAEIPESAILVTAPRRVREQVSSGGSTFLGYKNGLHG
jgi:hypothetical protein